MTDINDDATKVKTVASFTLFSRRRSDNSTLYYTIPRGLSFVMLDGTPPEWVMEKFQTYVDVVSRNPNRKFELHVGPHTEPNDHDYYGA